MKSDFEIENKEKEVFSNLNPNYSKSKKEVWNKINILIDQDNDRGSQTIIPIKNLWYKYSIAASLLIIFSLGLFMRFYTTEINTPNGRIAEHILPDGSLVELNAATTINYHPYWWKFKRLVNLEGEAFFKVKKGEKFNIVSKNGTTQVLGTSFNVYSRDNNYNVFCKSGKVRIRDNQSNEVILQPGQFAALESNKIELKNNSNSKQILSWKSDMFIYKNTPLHKVFKDFEIYYDIKIKTDLKPISKLNYTGIFKRKINIDQALEIVCYSFDLKLDKLNNHHYLIK